MVMMRKLTLSTGLVGVILAAAAMATGPDIGEQAEPLAHGHAFVTAWANSSPLRTPCSRSTRSRC